MWKFIPRGVKEALERIGRFECRNRTEAQNNYCKHFNNCCVAGEGREGRCPQPETTSNNDKRGRRTCFDLNNTWLGAFSCSGALALGWVISQPCIWRKWWGLKDRHQNNIRRPHFINIFTVDAISQPLTQNDNKSFTEQLAFSTDENNDVPYGPKTAEETLAEAVEEFESVHNKLVAEVENRKGVDCISENKYREALELFISSSSKGYPPAAYNLAQCFERGVGTKQNFIEAAKWYRKAAAQGHANAMYNLGVFYASGWGGLEQSSRKARHWLIKAARNGQPDARAALGMQDKNTEIPSIAEFINENNVTPNSDEHIDVSNDANELFKLAASFEASCNCDPITHSLISQLYKMAADFGQTVTKSPLQISHAFETMELFPELVCRPKPRIQLLSGFPKFDRDFHYY